ncbi:MAG: metallophosphoesterase family protein [Caldilineaceae bacterium]|nr:metallophosphoesterase family protein [Caldilineaceae bacterium]
MRIALLADIHGNLPAFEAVLQALRQQAPDLIILAGDMVVGAPDSMACWQLARSLQCPMVRGNHERYVGCFGTAQGEAIWQTEQFAPVQWAVAQCSAAERAAIADLPLALTLPEAPNLLVVHAAVRSDRENLPPHKADAAIAAMFPNVQEQWIVRGHDHLARTHPWRDKTIVTTGSVGLPMDGNAAAQYTLLDQTSQGWHVQHQIVDYDLQATLRRFADTRYVEQTGVMGRLFLRETATATPHFVPFLRYYHQWSQVEPLSLQAALERYLTHY